MSLELSHISEIENLNQKLAHYIVTNTKKKEYYTGANRIKSLGISLPRNLESMNVAVSFVPTAVDTLDERINLQGFYSEDFEEAQQIFFDNYLEEEAPRIHLDSLITGTAYGIVGNGADDEPEVLVTPGSPFEVVGRRNHRTRKLDSALHLVKIDDRESIGTLYLPHKTVNFAVINGEYYEDGAADEHGLGFVPVYQFVNRPQASNGNGRSEISDPLMALTDAAIRTSAGMEVTREHYGDPGKWMTNVDPREFVTKDGLPRNPFDAVQGGILTLGKGANTDLNGGATPPQVGQFSAGSPEPFISTLEYYATQVSALTSIPLDKFGIGSVNPPSADALRALENGLIQKAERRIGSFKRTWEELMQTAVQLKTGERPEPRSIAANFRKAETPTAAAYTDSVVKLVQSGILAPDSDLVLSALNLSSQDTEIWKREKSGTRTLGIVEKMAELRGGALPPADA